MKNRTLTSKIVFGLSLVLILAAAYTYVYDPLSDQIDREPNGLGSLDTQRYFEINPQTIVQSLGNGSTDVFVPLATTPHAPAPEGTVWQQNEFVQIADALFTFTWQETTADWHLKYLDLNRRCSENMEGMQLAEFSYFRTQFSKAQLSYLSRTIGVFPASDYVVVQETQQFPHPVFGWADVNLRKIRITAEQALQYADLHGGSYARLAAHNLCQIQVRISGDAPHWTVRIYRDDTGGQVFEMEIDPLTGLQSQ